MADRLGLSPNAVEEMFMDLAEQQIAYWAARAGKTESAPMGMGELARKFGGKMMGAPRGR